MGIFNFFKSRSQRESAVPPAEVTKVQTPVDSTPVGQMFPAQQTAQFTAGNLDLGQIAGMFGQAMKSGQAQVAFGNAQAINAQGTEMGEQIREVLKQHGVTDHQPGDQINVADAEGMQKQIMDVLAQHGLNIPGMEGANFSVETSGADSGSLSASIGELSNDNAISGDPSGSGDSASSGDSGGGDSGGGNSD